MLQLVISSLTQPGLSIVTVLRNSIPNQMLIRAAAVLACFTGIVDPLIAFAIIGPEALEQGSAPFVIALIQIVAILLTAVAIFRIGAMFGGQGDFNGALKVSVWYGLVSIIPSVLILIFQASGSGAAPVVQLFVLIWMLFILSSFIKVLHGFQSLFMTALGVIGASFVIGIAILMILASLGILQPGTM